MHNVEHTCIVLVVCNCIIRSIIVIKWGFYMKKDGYSYNAENACIMCSITLLLGVCLYNAENACIMCSMTVLRGVYI